MPARSRFVTIECLESRQLLSAAAAAVFDHADVAPVLPSVSAAPTHATSPQKVTAKVVGTTPTTTNLALDSASTNPAAQGSNVTFDAIVSPTVPTGDFVQFFDGVTMLGQSPVFAGSGTSLIAGQRTRRHVRAIELAPVYADVTLRRWQLLYPDIEPVLDGDGRTYDAIVAERRQTEA